MQTTYSRRSPAVKRLMKEAQELKDPTEQYFAQPLEDNLFEWHFTVRGPPDSDFAGGVYHGRITLPPEYPMKPPSIMLLTPTGRFEVSTKICLSISGHHPETWQPSWSIRTVLLAIIGFMPTKGEGAIGSLDYTPDERKVLARKSQDWNCDICHTPNHSILPAVTSKSADVQREAAELASKITFKKEEKKSTDSGSGAAPPPAAANNPVAVPPVSPFHMWNNHPGMVPFQPPIMPVPPNFMMPAQGQFGVANHNGQAPANQNTGSQSSTTENEGGPTSSTTAGTNQSQTTTDQSESSIGSQSSDGLRQRTIVTDRTSRRPPSSNQRTTASTPQTQDRGVEGLLCPLFTMSVFSFIIIILIARRFYIMYEYKFT